MEDGILTKKYRNIAFTLNNWTEDEYNRLKELDYTYIVIGKEVGECGTPHLQGYCEFKSQIRGSTLKKSLPRMSFRARYKESSPEAAANYCKKDDKNYFEDGTISQQGKRTDLIEMKENILNGESVDNIVIDNPMAYHQYGRTLNRIETIALRRRTRTWRTKGIWYYGPTGVGKSYSWAKDYTPDTHFRKNLRDEWWDGYKGQETVIFDDFRGQITFSELLELADDTPGITVKQRNREPVPFLAKTIIITSSSCPKDIYSNVCTQTESLNQLLRRFNVIYMPVASEVVGGNTSTNH